MFSSQTRKKILCYYFEATEWGPMCGVNDNVIAFQLKLSAFLFSSSPFWPVLTNWKLLSLTNAILWLALLTRQLEGLYGNMSATVIGSYPVDMFFRVLLVVCLHIHLEFHVSLCLGIWWRNVSQQLQNCLRLKFRNSSIVIYQVPDQSEK
jgi:hypothetical protein